MQLHGCYWYSRDYLPTKSAKKRGNGIKNRQRKYGKTLETTAYLRSKGFNVIEIWECIH